MRTLLAWATLIAVALAEDPSKLTRLRKDHHDVPEEHRPKANQGPEEWLTDLWQVDDNREEDNYVPAARPNRRSSGVSSNSAHPKERRSATAMKRIKKESDGASKQRSDEATARETSENVPPMKGEEQMLQISDLLRDQFRSAQEMSMSMSMSMSFSFRFLL